MRNGGCYMKEGVIHDRAYCRRMNWRKALRKRRIVHNHGYDFYDNLHQYSKNKIHCSCPDCRGEGEKISTLRRKAKYNEE